MAVSLLVAMIFLWPSPSAAADPAPARHIVYLHGRIVQETQSARPRHPRFGHYELDSILDVFRSRGFVVSGAIRTKTATVSESADQVVEQVKRLLSSGVKANQVTVVGASMGASIALQAAARLQNDDVRFCLLGACASDHDPAIRGRMLFIRESSDTSGPCAPSSTAREIVLHTGLDHGFLYRPLPAWVDPVVAWAEGAVPGPGCLPDSAGAAEARAVAAGIIAADNDRDMPRVLSYYAGDAALMPPGEDTVVGRDAIGPRYQRLFADFSPRIEGRVDEACVNGDRAFVRGHNGGRLVPRGEGTPRDLDDDYLMLLRREPDGVWRISHLIWHRG